LGVPEENAEGVATDYTD